MRRWIRRTAEGVRDQRDFLTQLDAAIGDADHGVNMDRGFFAAIAKLEASADDGPGQILETRGKHAGPVRGWSGGTPVRLFVPADGKDAR